MEEDIWVKATMVSILTVGLGLSTTAAASEPKLEKCYGIAKAGMNVCGTPLHTCEGTSKVDGDPAEWMYVLEGTCTKIVNGSTSPRPADAKEKK